MNYLTMLTHVKKMKNITIKHKGKTLKAINFKKSSETVKTEDFCKVCCFPMFDDECQNAPACTGDINGFRYGWEWEIVE